MRLAIMQPYFYPYIGYYQLLHCVDMIVLYDDIQYTKKGWVNRNRIQQKGHELVLTLPVKQAPHTTRINERIIADPYLEKRKRIMRVIQNAYCWSPYCNEVFPELNKGIVQHEANLFDYLYQSLQMVSLLLGLSTRTVMSSELDVDHTLKGQDKVLSICRSCCADKYVNLPGGQALYEKETFLSAGINLCFLDPVLDTYKQGHDTFISHLSIIDVLMCNGVELSKNLLCRYKINAA
jgi:hypothetical protein